MIVDGSGIIRQSTTLRGQGNFHEAIRLIEENLNNGLISPDVIFNAHREIFLAAKALGDTDKARAAAKEIQKEHPDLPSIQGYI